jgi:hypothetical protein
VIFTPYSDFTELIIKDSQELQQCGENGVKFDRKCSDKFNVGEISSGFQPYCKIKRSHHLAFFEYFIIFTTVVVHFENKWQGETFEFSVNDQHKLIKRPTWRVDSHDPKCDGDLIPDRQEEMHVRYRLNSTEGYAMIELKDNFNTTKRTELNWAFRELKTSVIGCPDGSDPEFGKGKNFTCRCKVGYFRNRAFSKFHCSPLALYCAEGTGPKPEHCLSCIWPYRQYGDDKICSLNDCKYLKKEKKEK